MASSFFNNLYIQIRPDWISLISSRDNIRIEGIPKIAINDMDKIEAVGEDAYLAFSQQHLVNRNIALREGFSLPGTIIGDYLAARLLLQHYILSYRMKAPLGGLALFSRQRRLILHPSNQAYGYMTAAQLKQLYDVGMEALSHPSKTEWGRRVYIWVGRDLLKSEIENLQFPSKGTMYDRSSFRGTR